MANSVEWLIEVNEVVVKVALVIWMFCNYDSAVEYMLYCSLSYSPRSQHIAWVADLYFCPAVLALYDASLRGITSDLVDAVGNFLHVTTPPLYPIIFG